MAPPALFAHTHVAAALSVVFLEPRLKTTVGPQRHRMDPVTMEEVDGRPLAALLRDGVARLLTPYL